MFQVLSLAKYNLRHNFLPQIGAAAGLLILTPALFGITALDAMTAAFPLELSLPFLGVILLTPLYASEQEPGVFDTVRARKTPYLLVCLLRIAMALLLTMLCIFGFVLLMRMLESDVSFIQTAASCANALFLGGLGILASSVSGNAIIGYMFAVLFFVMDLMGGFGSFTMFSMMRNGTTDGKWVLFAIGAFCIAASVGCLQARLKRT